MILSFVGLLLCAFLSAPHWVLTAVLALSGCGFGPASMAYLLAAQHSVAWQQRGIITSGIQFFRTIGGAIGTGLMGMMFNLLIRPEVQHLRSAGIDPGKLLELSAHDQLAPDVLHSVQRMIADGLLWVFVAMLAFACCQILASALMVRGRSAEPLTRAEAIEALAA